jgi:UTP--glucose-1-phosphate uridylyltransferase
MHITKAVITAAGRNQRTLPIQTLIDRDGTEKSVLGILIEEALSAGVEEVAVVVAPGDERPYAEVVGNHAGRLHFIPQMEPQGYGHAIYCAKDFVGHAPFLHLVGDHLYISGEAQSCAQQLVTVAEAENCAVSAVQATRENLLPYYGTVGGRRVSGRKDLYEVETVVEKPTPTEAELRLIVPGLRAGHYLCFFGMHVLTPTVMEILESQIANRKSQITKLVPVSGDYKSTDHPKSNITLSDALAVLATREKYLALEERAVRYDVGVKYGLLTAQLALALSGEDREEVITRLLELLATRELRGIG